MNLAFVFTDDWELFGNGVGCVRERQVKPALRFMEISEKYGAKYTFMAEASQYLAFKSIAGKYKEIDEQTEAWENTLKLAVRRGHDVQLHLHPQWDGATYEDGKWKLNIDNWSIPSLSEEHFRRLLRRGKHALESLLRPVNPEYECVCFRAGDWLTQPSETFIRVLGEEGFCCDSSILGGAVLKNKFGPCDYRNAYSNLFPWWINSLDINSRELDPSQKKVIEIPVYTENKYFPTFYPHVLKKFREKSSWIKKIYPLTSRPGLIRRNFLSSLLFSLWQFTFGRRVIMFDHAQLSAKHMLAMVSRIRKRASKENTDGILPVVTVTHSKIAYFYDEYENLLKGLVDKYGVEVTFLTFTEALQEVKKSQILDREI